MLGNNLGPDDPAEVVPHHFPGAVQNPRVQSRIAPHDAPGPWYSTGTSVAFMSLFFGLLPKLGVVGASPIARSLEVPTVKPLESPGAERVRAIFLRTRFRTSSVCRS
jgi:hypothetical protein